ncbi:MAG: 16S rRNA (adenine(1518)-N(6)/adenine(1519)-N(6))-dimethyltransferase RsmA [Bacteroidota bacterium]
MTHFTAKKHLGQHFLRDKNIARKIVNAISGSPQTLVEIGPGTGVLTALLAPQYSSLYLVEVDASLAAHLQQTHPALQERIIVADFLKLPLTKITQGPLTLIGNFPYNISSQIFFKVLDHRQQVQEVVAMIQQEVAARFVAQPGNKTYGILSVLLQAFYELEYLFSVPPQVFSPPPKVQSAVIRLRRNDTSQLDCDEQLFFRIVKMGFQQRRKTLRNALKSLLSPALRMALPLLDQRAEQLSVADYVTLTRAISMAD